MRAKLALSYAGFLMVAGLLLLAVVWLFLLRYVPDGIIPSPGPFVPNRSDLVRAFAPRAATMMACLLVLGLAGGWVLAGRMLAPLRAITEATRAAATGDLSYRIQMRGRQDEFRELADAFDTMLAQLHSHVDEQQRFAANASHELRTPLATIHAMVEVARTDPDRDVDELLERLWQVNTRAIALTDALLLLSRSGTVVDREQVDLSLMAEEAVESELALAEERGITLTLDLAPALVRGSPALLHQLVSNLVHNAIVHNVPREGAIWVRTLARGESIALRIDNTGAPVPAEEVPALLEPFQRGSARIRGKQSGVGLGLAIVSRIVQAHGGTVSIRPRGGGGLSIAVLLPHAPDLTNGDQTGPR